MGTVKLFGTDATQAPSLPTPGAPTLAQLASAPTAPFATAAPASLARHTRRRAARAQSTGQFTGHAGHGPRWRDYTAFVLSGGGARGALQVGALRALLERGIVPDVIVGTSIGAWNGAWLANDPTLHGVESLAEIWRGLRAEQLLLGYESFRAPTQSLAGLLVAMSAAPRLMMGFPSFYSDVGLRRLVKRCVGDRTFADLKATLRIIATDLTHGVRAVFSEGPLMEPILASSAIPAVFPPVRIGDSVYADGFALDNCSIETALNLGARRIFVLSVGYDDSAEDSVYWSKTLAPQPQPQAHVANGALASQQAHPPQSGQSNPQNPAPQGAAHVNHNASHGMAAIFERITQVMGYYQLSQALARIPRGVETHVIQLPSNHLGGMLDFEVAGKWMDVAYGFTRDYLDHEQVGAHRATAASDKAPLATPTAALAS